MGKKKTPSANQNAATAFNTAQQFYNSTREPSALENEFAPVSQQYQGYATQAADRNMADYGNIMGGYQDFMKNLPGATKFSYRNVSAERPKELGEAYGYLRETVPGYRDFAETGGYSPTDIQELRARSMSPVRAAYGNTMMELNRARSLGGGGGAPNYIAALSRAQRELPEQLATASTGINAQLADAIRQGKLAGLGGIAGIGSTMGGLSSEEAGRMLQAAMANQSADLQAQSLSESSLQNRLGMQLSGLGGMTGLYGTTPGLASTFGNQALSAYNTRAGMEQARDQFGLGAIDAMTRASANQYQTQGQPWWQKALGIAGTVAPFFSSRKLKTDIKRVKNVSKFAKYLDELPMYTWRYKGETTRHFGPIAEEFRKKLGIGDGKTIHPADIAGVVIAASKEAVAHA